MKEIWKDIPDYGGYYQASNLGNIRRVKCGVGTKIKNGIPRNLKAVFGPKGYARVLLYVDTKASNFSVHRLVMYTFTGKSNLCINHKDGVKSNNKLSNLEYVSHTENMIHAAKNNLMAKGEQHGYSKLTNIEVRQIKKLLRRKSKTHREIGILFGVSRSTITVINTGKNWKHIC